MPLIRMGYHKYKNDEFFDAIAKIKPKPDLVFDTRYSPLATD